jgi:predicted MFS family arabinose efflux permease
MAAIFCLSLGLGGLMIHFVPVLLDLGLTTSAAVKIYGDIGIAVVLGHLLVGFAVDRIFTPRVAIATLFACICGVLALGLLGSTVAVPAAFVIGFSVGAEVDLLGYLVARYFGIHAYGQIYGRQYSTFLITTDLSAVILGVVRDATGTCNPPINNRLGFDRSQQHLIKHINRRLKIERFSRSGVQSVSDLAQVLLREAREEASLREILPQ